VELIRRMDAKQAFALTTPLLTTASGAKMGKTAAGAVWLNRDMLSVYDYWQFWRNTEDGDVGRFLRLFTDMPEGEIARLAALQGAELNDAKKVLATEATALLHGRDAADKVADTARRTLIESRRRLSGKTRASLPLISDALRAKDPERHKAAQSRSFQKHKAKRMAEAKAWRQQNKERSSIHTRTAKAKRRAAEGQFTVKDIDQLVIDQSG